MLILCLGVTTGVGHSQLQVNTVRVGWGVTLLWFWSAVSLLWAWSDRSHALSLPLPLHKCGFISQPLTLVGRCSATYISQQPQRVHPFGRGEKALYTPPAGGRQTGMNVSSCWSFLWKIVQKSCLSANPPSGARAEVYSGRFLCLWDISETFLS